MYHLLAPIFVGLLDTALKPVVKIDILFGKSCEPLWTSKF